MKSTKTLKERREILKDYIIKSINSSGYNIKEPKNNKDKLLFVLGEFKSEKLHDIKREGVYKAFSEHLAGLHSYLNIDFEYYKIIQLLKNLGYENLTEKEQDKILNNYWDYMTTQFFYLCRSEKINYKELLK